MLCIKAIQRALGPGIVAPTASAERSVTVCNVSNVKHAGMKSSAIKKQTIYIEDG